MLSEIVNLERYPIDDLKGFGEQCKSEIDETGSLLLPGFVRHNVIGNLIRELCLVRDEVLFSHFYHQHTRDSTENQCIN